MVALAMSGCGSAYAYALESLGIGPERASGMLFVLLLAVAAAYFAASTLLMVTLLKLKRGEPVRPLQVLREHGWLGIRYVASAAIGWLLYVSYERFGASVLVLVAPIIALLLSTLRTRNGGSDTSGVA
jgi:hypothetical protein